MLTSRDFYGKWGAKFSNILQGANHLNPKMPSDSAQSSAMQSLRASPSGGQEMDSRTHGVGNSLKL
jgi:hypothetical protein